jgi:hypothetical protein
MFEQQAVAKPKRRRTSMVAESMEIPAPSWDPTPAQPKEAATPQRPGVGFDFSSISIFPPEPQVGPEGGNLTPDLTDRIRGKQNGGAPLEPSVQHKMEAGFGHNFADVRIHADSEADILNRSVNANAFTLGSDIFLSQAATSAGAYGGDRLLAHELTHVVQQRDARQGETLTVGAANDASEQEADSVAKTIGLHAGTMPDIATDAAGGGMIRRDPPPTSSSSGNAPTLEDLFENYNRTNQSVMSTKSDQATASTKSDLVASWSARVYAAQPHDDIGEFARAAHSADSTLTANIGDHIVVEAKIKDFSNLRLIEGEVEITPLEKTLKDNLKVVSEGWTSIDTYGWTLVPIFGGHHKVQFALGLGIPAVFDPGPMDRHEITIVSRANADWFLKELTMAKGTIDAFYKHGEEWLPQVFKNYKAAYTAFDTALSAKAAADKNHWVRDIVLAVVFAGAAGVVGGMVNAASRGVLDEDMKKVGTMVEDAFERAKTTGIVTAYQDITKTIILAGKQPATNFINTTPAGGQGAQAVPADDPLTWYVTIMGKIAGEQANVDDGLVTAQRATMEQMVLDPGVTFDWDPVAVAVASAKLAGNPLSPLPPVPEEKDYAGGFWKLWLQQYAWTVEWEDRGGHAYPSTENNIGDSGPLYRALDIVARENGATADQWIEQFGSIAKKNAKDELKEIEAEDDEAYRESLYDLTH